MRTVYVVGILVILCAIGAHAVTRDSAMNFALIEGATFWTSAGDSSAELISSLYRSEYATASPWASDWPLFPNGKPKQQTLQGNPYAYGCDNLLQDGTVEARIQDGKGIGASPHESSFPKPWAAGLDCASLIWQAMEFATDQNTTMLDRYDVTLEKDWSLLCKSDIVLQPSTESSIGHVRFFKEWETEGATYTAVEAALSERRVNVTYGHPVMEAGYKAKCFFKQFNCDCSGHNSSAEFEGVWAFRDADGTHVCWTTGVENSSRTFSVIAFDKERGVVAEVPAEGGSLSHFYEIVVHEGVYWSSESRHPA